MLLVLKWGFPKIMGTFLGGPNKKDYSILGSILGSPYFGKLPSSTGSGISGQHVGIRDGRGIFMWGLGCIWKFLAIFQLPYLCQILLYNHIQVPNFKS